MLTVCLLCSVLSQSGPPAEQVKAERRSRAPLQEIQRGVFFEAQAGFWGVLNPPVLAGGSSSSYFSPGLAVKAQVGVDLGELFSLSLFFLATANRMSNDYTGLSGGTASGDFGMVVPGLDARLRFGGFEDNQGIRRTWLYVRLGAGYVFYGAAGFALFDGQRQARPDVLVYGGPGIEYFTRLRHFSIALEATFNAAVLTQTWGFAVLPSVRYAF